MKTIKYLCLIVLASSLLSACQKNETPLSSDEINLADDEALTEALFDDIYSSVDNVAQMLDGFSKGTEIKSDVITLVDSCPVVSVDLSDEMFKTITIDYGDGCTGFYEKVRSGKIIIEVNGLRRQVGSYRTITFDNFYFNGIKMEGTKVTENMGLNENDNTVFMSSLTDGKLIFPNNIVIERAFTRYREFIAGYDTRNIWDDECLITGTATGVTYKGISYENTISSALHWKRVCRFFISGVIEINRSGSEPFELDYGDGECDAIATIRRGDEEKEITLKWNHRTLR